MFDKEFMQFIGGFLGFIFVVITLVFVVANWSSSVSCRNTADLMGLKHQYFTSTGCLVEVDGRYEPMDWQRSVRLKNAE